MDRHVAPQPVEIGFLWCAKAELEYIKPKRDGCIEAAERIGDVSVHLLGNVNFGSGPLGTSDPLNMRSVFRMS